MFVPLFTPASAERARAILAGVARRIEAKEGNVGRRSGEWGYVDRYLVFSANHFMAAIARYYGRGVAGAGETAEEYQRRCLELGPGGRRDLFWAQTALLMEQRLRAEGRYGEADALRAERMEAEGDLGVRLAELQWPGGQEGGVSPFRGLEGAPQHAPAE
ncbi:hypothetical protein VTK26DRAFT_3114 [Humicola hyalothermophila]